MNKVLAIVGAVIAMSLLLILGMFFHYNNQEKKLHVQIEAQRGKIEGVHDKMWKVITQKAEVSSDYRTSFDSIYVGIMQGRYSDGGGQTGMIQPIIEGVAFENPYIVDFISNLRYVSNCIQSMFSNSLAQFHLNNLKMELQEEIKQRKSCKQEI